MFWKNAMKYPVLIAGIIMFGIFIMDPKTQIWWQKTQGRYIPSTCQALADRIDLKKPAEWEIECPSTSRLLLKVAFKHEAPKDQSKELATAQFRKNIYRSLANDLKKFSAYANPETLQNLNVLEIFIVSDQIEVWGTTDGQAVARLRELKSKKEIAEHLELTVKVKEKIK